MSQIQIPPAPPEPSYERSLQSLLTAYVVAGLLFMLLPGTFLGVWNLISISGQESLSSLSPAWIQAHGHAQIFGWIGTFVIGIGYFSLSKMGAIQPFAIMRGWLSWSLWTSGVVLRWIANVTLWNWRVLLPLSAAAELIAFGIFFHTVSRHKRTGRGIEIWMALVIASTIGFLLLLMINAAIAGYLAFEASAPEIPHWLDQRFLVLATWGFPVLAVWGFNARWLPAFAGLKPAWTRGLRAALWLSAAGVIAALAGKYPAASVLLIGASVLAADALGVFEPSEKPPILQGVHAAFPAFIRLTYVWLLTAGGLSLWASFGDRSGGIWGASRHALTVGFLAGMIFAVGPRILPSFLGGRQIFSPRIMFAACSLLSLGCLLRVASEIPAYEGAFEIAWRILPVSAVVELSAVTLFAFNLALTLLRPAAAVADTRLFQISLSQGPKHV